MKQNNGLMTMDNAKSWYDHLVNISKEILKEKLDYGKIPGVSKPSLLKPGAEKLRVFFALQYELERASENDERERDFYDVTYKAIIRAKDGTLLSQCEGSCNTQEDKYRYRRYKQAQKPSDFDELQVKGFARCDTIASWAKKNKRSKAECDNMKAEGNGRWKKEGGDWQRYEKEGTEISYSIKKEYDNKYSLKNTIQKMAQKRAFVGAILIATGASEFYTQDVEDMDVFTDTVPVVVTPATPEVSDEKTSKPEFNGKQTANLEEKLKKGEIVQKTEDELISFIKLHYVISAEKETHVRALFTSYQGETVPA